MPVKAKDRLSILGPLVLAANLLLLLRRKVVGDVEGFANLLGRLALDHVGHGLAADIKQRLNVQVVGCEDDLKEHLLVDLHELLIPLLNLGGSLASIGLFLIGGGGVATVMLAPLDHLAQNRLGNLYDHVSKLPENTEERKKIKKKRKGHPSCSQEN